MKLGQYLKKHKIRQQVFADRVGVSQSAVCRWIAGTQMPEPRMIMAISRATDGKVGLDDFVEENVAQ